MIARRTLLLGAATSPLAFYVGRKRWADPSDRISPDAFSDIGEMFEVSKAVIVLPDGNYEFHRPIRTSEFSRIEADQKATLLPSFRLQGADRVRPLFTLSKGSTATALRMELKAGINNVRTAFLVKDLCGVKTLYCSSHDLNNNRIEPGTSDLVSGAVVISGRSISVVNIEISRFDAGWAVVDSSDVLIESIKNTETIRGGYVHGTDRLEVKRGFTTGPKDHSEPNAFVYGRGIMTPGANSLLLAGCSNSSFSNWRAQDTLEHAIRVGQIASGTKTPNHNLSFTNLELIRPYGCGFKCDDADDFNIKHIIVHRLQTEDVGRDNWHDTPAHENWSEGGKNNPAKNSDGNKVACAIRNSEFVSVSNFRNVAKKTKFSGHFGLWLERTRHASITDVETRRSLRDGVVIQSGGSTAPDDLVLQNITTEENGGDGLKLNATPSDENWGEVSVANLVSRYNAGAGVSVTSKRDGGYPFDNAISYVRGKTSENVEGDFLPESDTQGFGNLVMDLNDHIKSY